MRRLKAIRGGQVLISVRRPKWIGGSGSDCEFQARVEGQQLRAASLICARAAVENAAMRWFFGGHTRRFTKGRDARTALKVRGLGHNRYAVSLKEAA